MARFYDEADYKATCRVSRMPQPNTKLPSMPSC